MKGNQMFLEINSIHPKSTSTSRRMVDPPANSKEVFITAGSDSLGF
jgi:hypothetical protein